MDILVVGVTLGHIHIGMTKALLRETDIVRRNQHLGCVSAAKIVDSKRCVQTAFLLHGLLNAFHTSAWVGNMLTSVI